MKKFFTLAGIFLIVVILTLEGVLANGATVASNPVNNIAEAISDLLVDQIIKGWMIGTLHTAHVFFDSVYRNLPTLILANPTMESISPGLRFFFSLVIPFYILGILLTSIYLLFLSGSPAGRSMAKGNLLRLIYSLVLISLSPFLLNLLFLLSSSATSYVMNLVDIETGVDIIEGATDGFYDMIIRMFSWYVLAEGAAGWFAGVLTISYYVLYLLLVGRVVFVTMLGMMMPLMIFLYSFYSTKGLGKTLFRQLLFLTFIQIIWGLTLVAFAIAVPTIYDHVAIPQVIVNISAYFIFWFAPWVVLGLMDWFPVAVLIIDAGTTGPLCVGPVVMDELYAGREIAPEEETAPEYI